MKEKKKFKDTKLFGAIKKFAPAVIDGVTDVAATIYPPLGIVNGIVDTAMDVAIKNGDKEAVTFLKEARDEYTIDYIEYERILAEDRANARSREITIATLGRDDWMMIVTGICGLLAFGTVVYAILFNNLPDNALIHQLVGIVEGVALTIFAYYFGTSKGSRDKDKKVG